jgi:excinuclease ABC subunit C
MPTQAVTEKLATLPTKPGVYLHKDNTGKIIYVGKAINLRNRVRSYFQRGANHTPKVRRLVQNIADLEYIVCGSELEALVLENQLIKKHQPHYNVRLRDDRQYPYLCLTTSEPFPRLVVTRKARQDKNRYFGPYSNSRAVYSTLELVNRTFPLISCNKSFDGRPVQKPCLYHHLGQCLAPCAGIAEKVEYAKAVQDVTDFLNGRGSETVKKLRADMEEAAENLEFERAARIRDRLQGAEEILTRQRVISEEMVDQDVIAVVEDNTGLNGACVQMFFIRGGRLLGESHYLIEGTDEQTEGEVVQEFMKQYYADANFIPEEIILPTTMDETAIIESWLKQRKGKKVEIQVPVRGDKKKLLDMATENASHALEQIKAEMRAKMGSAQAALQELADALGLEKPPMRIECYDISNTQGADQVAAMVVCERGEMAKREYRKFKIKRDDGIPNDYASMQEVITRRLAAARSGDPKFMTLPDLIIVDGGRGQVASAVAAMQETDTFLPLAGLAKQFEHLFRPNEPDPVILPRKSQALYLIQRIRDEAHRFANAYRTVAAKQRNTKSALEEIPGIGPKRRKALQVHFGGMVRVKAATVDEIAAVPGFTRKIAEAVYDHLHSV